MSEVLKQISQHFVLQKSISWTSLNIEKISIFLMWLFTTAALIGFSLGFKDWFLPKTPLNLLLCFLLMLINVQLNKGKGAFLFTISFAVGMIVEIIGVSSGILFGVYEYGSNLGFKAWGVPLMIGIYWAVLVVVTSQMARSLTDKLIPVVIIASSLMVGLDYVMEHLAGEFDFWYFEGGIAGIQNYIAWFIVAAGLHCLSYYWLPKSNAKFSTHLYLNQLVFFCVALLLLRYM